MKTKSLLSAPTRIIANLRSAVSGLLAAFALAFAPIAQAAPQYTTIFSFNGTNGNYPFAGLLCLSNGLIYGTTYEGGIYGQGNIFAFNPATTSIVATFDFNITNGYGPTCTLIQGQDGNLYGTASIGSSGFDSTVFRISTNLLSFTNLHTFVNIDAPASSLIQWTNGYLFGTTYSGGLGEGTWFSMTTNGVVENTFSFGGINSAIGGHPVASLGMGSNGTLYGTTTQLGSNNDGTIFSISSGSSFSALFSFNATNGTYPWGPLLMASDGYLYGTTYGNPPNTNYSPCGFGTVFKFNPTNNVLTTLYVFTNGVDGAWPAGGLIEVSNGVFYGTTFTPGGIFQITSSGAFTNLVFFNESNGYGPADGLARGADGNYYGTASVGGTNPNGTYGTIFRLSPAPSLNLTPPQFHPPAITNGILTITASAVTGQSYQLQYRTNLASGSWSGLGNPVTASNGIVTFADTMTGTQKYYRVQLAQ